MAHISRRLSLSHMSAQIVTSVSLGPFEPLSYLLLLGYLRGVFLSEFRNQMPLWLGICSIDFILIASSFLYYLYCHVTLSVCTLHISPSSCYSITATILDTTHRCFGDWILSPFLRGTYSDRPNRKSLSLSAIAGHMGEMSKPGWPDDPPEACGPLPCIAFMGHSVQNAGLFQNILWSPIYAARANFDFSSKPQSGYTYAHEYAVGVVVVWWT
jgi:hypothetical protein